MVDNVSALIAQLLDPVVQDSGLWLETVRVVGAGKHTVVRVTVDLPAGPGGVDSTQLTDVSRAISQVLDEHDPIRGAYTLEVSTPGATRELSQERHFSRSIGRKVAFVLADGTKLTERICDVADGVITLAGNPGTIAVADVARAHVILELNKAGGEN
ncbi:ribosome maturation factor RimP [Arcanobacterium buesumense]|uniref:Ribosome maturation factor RimP n=1 Tax=Arcanobacterium buesumense TaxID=2722751 RepID=A0A6H2EKY8_9ACTO|nr:ribosome maturation factor RimP [Arcanobacterium buesumense]QJC21571.1 ribosome maturation factor RimP [Arcanobacterium buesumense]